MSKLDEIYELLIEDMNLKNVERGTLKENPNVNYVKVSVAIAGEKTDLHFISEKEGTNEFISFRTFGLVRFAPEQRAKALAVVNDINISFKLLKFTLDSDNIVTAELDFPDYDDMRVNCKEVLMRADRIISDAYPILMKAKWA